MLSVLTDQSVLVIGMIGKCPALPTGLVISEGQFGAECGKTKEQILDSFIQRDVFTASNHKEKVNTNIVSKCKE